MSERRQPKSRATEPATKPVRKVRLLKVIVQPIIVVDDGETLSEHAIERQVVAPADWPDYPTKGFAEAFERLRADIEGPEASGAGLAGGANER